MAPLAGGENFSAFWSHGGIFLAPPLGEVAQSFMSLGIELAAFASADDLPPGGRFPSLVQIRDGFISAHNPC